MTHVGIDIEQFVTDPYGSGIQRVLQYLALEWPEDRPSCTFVLPDAEGHLLMDPAQAAEILSIPFQSGTSDAGEIRSRVTAAIADARSGSRADVVEPGTLLSIFDRWLLPEVSYLPTVLDRFEVFAECMPVAMIGYDALPMIEPANYRFPPGTAAQVSRYFHLLVRSDALVCISEYSRESIWDRLRRPRSALTTVAHPGGDHIEPTVGSVLTNRNPSSEHPTLLKVGTLEARKKPVETLDAFRIMKSHGWMGNLTLIGRPSASDPGINRAVQDALSDGIGVTWIQDARDAEVLDHLREADLFLSLGTEGYGIPVLEAISQGLPVVFDGIQPAARLMEGRGAFRIDARDSNALAESLIDAASSRSELAAAIDVSAIPTWRNFVRGVVAVLDAS